MIELINIIKGFQELDLEKSEKDHLPPSPIKDASQGETELIQLPVADKQKQNKAHQSDDKTPEPPTTDGKEPGVSDNKVISLDRFRKK